MIEVRGISKRFPGVIALQDVSLAAQAGEVVAIIGENGAGKSTLMKVLAGVHQPEEGQILWNGHPVRLASPSDSLALGIRIIYQELSVLDNLDVTANVFLGREKRASMGRLDTAAMRAETDRILRRLDVSISADARVAGLSLAERQLVEIARALSMDAKLLILDEPTSSLTLDETQKLLSLVRELSATGVTVFYVSHRLDEIIQVADRVVALRDGQNAGGLAKSEINQPAMVRLMIGRDLEAKERSVTDNSGPIRLQLKDVCTERFPTKPLNLEVRAGEILGMAGLVGSGRTEVVEAVFGIQPAVRGEIILDEHVIDVSCPRDAINAGICLIPEDRRRNGLSVTMSVKENVSMPSVERFATAGLLRRDEEEAWAKEQVSRFGVKTASVDVAAANLSGGNQQKVVLARWLSLGPKVILFDEPTRGVDIGARAAIYEEMRALAREGAAILMVSSDMEEVLGVSDRIAVMHEGQLTGILSRNDATEERVMFLAVGRKIEEQ